MKLQKSGGEKPQTKGNKRNLQLVKRESKLQEWNNLDNLHQEIAMKITCSLQKGRSVELVIEDIGYSYFIQSKQTTKRLS